jgi:hypothetical protein
VICVGIKLLSKAKALEYRGIRDPGLSKMEYFHPLWFLAPL